MVAQSHDPLVDEEGEEDAGDDAQLEERAQPAAPACGGAISAM